jgi:Kef-type K+ transport system membrane component KefB
MEAMITAPLIINLMFILVAALVMGNIFSRFGQPFLLGQLLAGLLLGPAFLGLIGPSEGIDLLADFGIFFVMFHSGMETDPKLLLAKLKHSLIVAVGGFVLPFALGYFATRIFGGTVFQALFVGMGISISAIAVQVVILHDMKINRTSLGHVIIGAAIADDILALVTLSVLINVAESGSAQPAEIAFILLKVGAFFGAAIFLGHYVVPRFTRRFHEREGRAFTFAITVALVLAFHLHISTEASFLLFALVLIVVAVIGKLAGCGITYALISGNRWEGAVAGFGMNGRGGGGDGGGLGGPQGQSRAHRQRSHHRAPPHGPAVLGAHPDGFRHHAGRPGGTQVGREAGLRGRRQGGILRTPRKILMGEKLVALRGIEPRFDG